MDENMLQRYIADGDAFSLHVGQDPALAQYVNQKLIILHQTFGSASVVDIQAAIAAANGLHMVARAEGFDDMAALFYRCYEKLCHALMVLL